MLNLRYIVRLMTAFISRFKVILFFGIILGVLFFVALGNYLPLIFDKSTETIGVSGRFTTSEIPLKILNNISQGLTKIEPDGKVVPDLAESWQISDDHKTWTFHLKPDLKWQDGSVINSNDIKYNYEDVQVSYPDKKTIVFKLNSVFAPFPTVVARPVFKKGLLGTGEWKVTDLSLTGNFVEKLTLLDTEGNRKIYKFYPSEERLKLAFKLGEISKIEDVIDPKPFNTWKTLNIESSPNQNRYVGVFFNTQDEVLQDKNIRQALSYAIDKSKFGFERAYGPISPMSWAYNPQTKPYDYGPDRAKELIKDSGLGEDKKNNLKIKLTTVPALLETAEKVAADWKAIGVDTSIQVSPTIPNVFQAFLIIYDIPTDPDQYVTWHGVNNNPANISRLEDQRISKLLEDGRLEIDFEARKKIYLDFQRFLVEEAPVAFLYHPNSYTIGRK